MSAEENPKPQSAEPEPAKAEEAAKGNKDNNAEAAKDADKDPAGSDQATMKSVDEMDFGDRAETDDQQVESDDLQSELEKAQARADENWERVLRMQADMENQRKRAQKDVENARKFALEGVVNDLLPVRDSLEMGLAAAQETDADALKIVEGSELTLKMLSQAFEKYNIVEINPIDQKFDPEFHQAMSMQEVEGRESNTVTGVLQKGYTLNDRLIRPALVMVAK